MNTGRYTAIYIVLIFLLLVHTAPKDLDLTVAGLDTSLVLCSTSIRIRNGRLNTLLLNKATDQDASTRA